MRSPNVARRLSRRGFLRASAGAPLLVPIVARHASAIDPRPPVAFSGIYPHLAYWNRENECGTGAVVPWAGRLWVITYGPHLPNGSSDKLYEIDDALRKTTRPESVGGTPANRMIHRESGQLLIGPYLIDEARRVRVIPPRTMPGRLTGNARHLADPGRKVYYATMEEGLYEVDVRTLQVKELYRDANALPDRAGPLLPGYHGKGLYSGQGRVIYANNGELSKDAQSRPEIVSGVLAEWDGEDWRVVRRNQFTDVSGPGGLEGNPKPETDPVWSIGWDHRSLLLNLLDGGTWQTFRLPKPSHCHDGAHGWNTEWPRIRDIGENALLMTMHGAFWRFPRTFSLANSAGLALRSTHLKVVGDFCRWRDRIVVGCDDSAKSEFLNKRKAKGALAGPSISNSNLWFLAPESLDRLGPPRGVGAVWLGDPVQAGKPSDPFLFSAFERRAVLLSHDADTPVTFTFEVDRAGTNRWQPLREETVPASGSTWREVPSSEKGAWVRIRASRDCRKASAVFSGSNPDPRTDRADAIFDGLALPGADGSSGGLLHVGGTESPVLRLTAERLYEMGDDLTLRPVDDARALAAARKAAAIPTGTLQSDAGSLLYVDETGRRFRLPHGDPALFDRAAASPRRVCREVCTERDLFHAEGVFYELPAENAGGFARIRPIASHGFSIADYGSWRGLLVLSGVAADAAGPRIVRSTDGRVAVWLGAVDDLWKLGKPRGRGGPWHQSRVQAGEPSDPYLCNGFDNKRLRLTHEAGSTIAFRLDADFTGAGDWHAFERFDVPAGKPLAYDFPAAFQAYWVRLVAEAPCVVTAVFQYK